MNEIKKNINKLLESTLANEIDKALERAGQLVENEAVERCPVDTGTLRASITHEPTKDGKSVIIGTDVEYAPFVHERSKPFLQDAIDQNLTEIAECFTGILKGVKL